MWEWGWIYCKPPPPTSLFITVSDSYSFLVSVKVVDIDKIIFLSTLRGIINQVLNCIKNITLTTHKQQCTMFSLIENRTFFFLHITNKQTIHVLVVYVKQQARILIRGKDQKIQPSDKHRNENITHLFYENKRAACTYSWFASLKHLTLYHLSKVFYGGYNPFFFFFYCRIQRWISCSIHYRWPEYVRWGGLWELHAYCRGSLKAQKSSSRVHPQSQPHQIKIIQPPVGIKTSSSRYM